MEVPVGESNNEEEWGDICYGFKLLEIRLLVSDDRFAVLIQLYSFCLQTILIYSFLQQVQNILIPPEKKKKEKKK